MVVIGCKKIKNVFKCLNVVSPLRLGYVRYRWDLCLPYFSLCKCMLYYSMMCFKCLSETGNIQTGFAVMTTLTLLCRNSYVCFHHYRVGLFEELRWHQIFDWHLVQERPYFLMCIHETRRTLINFSLEGLTLRLYVSCVWFQNCVTEMMS